MSGSGVGLTDRDGGTDGGEDEDKGGEELGEIRAEGRERDGLLQLTSDRGSHFFC